MATCPDEYLIWTGDAWEPEHSCRLDEDHDGMHECPECGAYWHQPSFQEPWIEVLSGGS